MDRRARESARLDSMGHPGEGLIAKRSAHAGLMAKFAGRPTDRTYRCGRRVSACVQQPGSLPRLDAAPAGTTGGPDGSARTPSDEVSTLARSDASRRDLGEASCRRVPEEEGAEP